MVHEETEHKNELEKIYYEVVHSGVIIKTNYENVLFNNSRYSWLFKFWN